MECQTFTQKLLLRKNDFLKLRFSKFKKFASRSSFGQPQLMQISLNFLKRLIAT